MSYLLYTTIIGLLSGVFGTLGGGLVMTVVIFFDLLPEAQEMGSIWSSLTGVILGVVLIGLLDMLFPHQHFVSSEDGRGKYLKAGLLLAIGIALHNLPEGLAIGAGYSSTSSMGLGLAVIMAVQNFPEGMAIATTLSLAGLKSSKVALITFLSAIPMGKNTSIIKSDQNRGGKGFKLICFTRQRKYLTAM